MKYLFYLCLIVLVSSCNNTEQASVNNYPIGPARFPQGQQASNASGATTGINPPHEQPGHSCAIPVGAPLNSASQSPPTQNMASASQFGPSASSVSSNQTTVQSSPPIAVNQNDTRLNPKHGDPGHRCDIAVGAPLNSPAPNSGSAATMTANAPVSASLVKGVKINPAHGQPGHRCDIAVGAPLNSKPVMAAPAPKPAPVVSAEPVVVEQANGGNRGIK